ncbi:TPA: hypothetical protein DD712_02440 [Candidatus Acetothermia bacterium]|nr:hypothetical protein [Candidatus Acetothermia bacterium]
MQDLHEFSRLFSAEFSGERAKRMAGQIAAFDRGQVSPGIKAAIELVKSELEKAELAAIKIHRFPVDGKSYWWTWKQPWHWTASKAELRLIEPEEILLADFAAQPCSLGRNSAATPPKGIIAPVIDVGRGLSEEDYSGKEVTGAVVLISGAGWGAATAAEEAAQQGAIGVITDCLVEMPPLRTRENSPEQIGYNRVRVEDNGSAIFSFAVNYHHMTRLRELTKGKRAVKVQATIDSELATGDLLTLSAAIEGEKKRDEEVLLIAHICHPAPGANDNASGTALILEIARTWNRLISDGKWPRPTRTIRFMWVPEWTGTIAYLHAQPEWTEQLQLVISCDMVGENQQLCGGPLIMERTPDAVPSYINDLGEHFLEKVPVDKGSYSSSNSGSLWQYRVGPYGGGTDNAPFVQCNVPAIAFLHWPDKFYHSSADTVDKIDPTELSKVGQLVAHIAQAVTSAEEAEVSLFVYNSFQRGLARLGESARETVWALHQITDSQKIALEMDKGVATLNYRAEIEKKTVASVARLGGDDQRISAMISDCQTKLEEKSALLQTALLAKGRELAGEDTGASAITRSPSEIEAAQLIPIRKWTGPLNGIGFITAKLGWKRVAWLRKLMTKDLSLRTITDHAAMWVDGKRNLLEIARRVTLSTGISVEVETLIRYFRHLAEVEVIELRTNKKERQ